MKSKNKLPFLRFLTSSLNMCYYKGMFRLLFSITTLSMLISVQSFGVVCKTKCSLKDYSVESSNTESNESHQNCHSQSEDTEKSDSKECGDVCKADDLFSDSKIWKIEKKIQDQNYLTSNLVEIVKFVNHELVYNISTHDPPGIGFYSGVPIFIQKSSYLI